MKNQILNGKIIIVFIFHFVFIASCSIQANVNTTADISTYTLQTKINIPTKKNNNSKTSSKVTNTPTCTITTQDITAPISSTTILSLPECKDKSFPEGKLLLTSSSINTIIMGCSSTEGYCPYEINEVYQYYGFIMNATWSPDGKNILFAADIDAPPMREGTGGVVTETRLFSISPNEGIPKVLSGRGGYVNQIESCRGTDRILYERMQDITRIYMIDSSGYGSAFSHNGNSVRNPSCSPKGEDIGFITEENELYVKHVGNSIHTFIDDHAGGKASWSPNQRYIAYSHLVSPSVNGTCIASIKLDTDELPQVLSPCPIPGTGTDPKWSTDGETLLTNLYGNQEEPGKIFILQIAIEISGAIIMKEPPQIINGINASRQSTLWIGPNHILIIQRGEYPEKDEIIIVNFVDNCISEKIEIPLGFSDPDWYPS